MELYIKWNLCRVCLSEEKTDEDENDKGGGLQMQRISQKPYLSQQIFDISGVKMRAGEGMPDTICRQCINWLHKAFAFRTLCRDSNSKLCKIITQTAASSSILRANAKSSVKLKITDFMGYEEPEKLSELKSEKVNKQPQSLLLQNQVKKNERAEEKMEQLLPDFCKLPKSTSGTMLNNEIETTVDCLMDSLCADELALESYSDVEEDSTIRQKTVKSSLNYLMCDYGTKEQDELENKATEKPASYLAVQKNKNSAKTADCNEDNRSKSINIIEVTSFNNTTGEEAQFLIHNETDDDGKSNDVISSDLQENLLLDIDVNLAQAAKTEVERLTEKKNELLVVESGTEDDGSMDFITEVYVEKSKNCDYNEVDTTDADAIEQATELYEIIDNAKVKLEYQHSEYDINDEELDVDVAGDADADRDREGAFYETSSIELIEDDADLHLNLVQEHEIDTTTFKNDEDNDAPKEFASFSSKTTSKSEKRSLKKVSVLSMFECTICGNTFTARSILNQHMRLHSAAKSFECELCFKRFNSACNLRAHIRIHTGERPFVCKYCGRSFSDRSTQVKHERGVHTNEKPFKCSICESAFALSTSLKAHERIHTGEKPYKCLPCNKSFKLQHQLKAHNNTQLHNMLLTQQRLYEDQEFDVEEL